jgi:hypothetical protein
MEAVPYRETDAEAWDELVAVAPMATFLHSRRFLGYHGDRFEDASLMVRDGEKLIAAIPAARDPSESTRVVSHPGATFGGLVHDGALAGERMREALTASRDAYRDRGFATLIYKSVPWIYRQTPSDDDRYALFRLGAEPTRLDLSCAIDLSRRRPPGSRRKRGRKKAEATGVRVSESTDQLPAFWEVLEENLSRRHGATPVHSLEEILLIAELFPGQVRLLVATLEESVIGGAVLFESPHVSHVQYNAVNEQGREVSALDAVFERCIEEAESAGRRFFDFGISTEAEGQELNEDLYRFKFEFGGGGVAHEFYELAL